MRSTESITRWLAIGLTLALSAGCGKGGVGNNKPSKSDPDTDEDRKGEDPNDSHLPAGFTNGTALLETLCQSQADATTDYEVREKLLSDVNDFAKTMTQKLLKGDKNGVVSPLSVQFAFALLRGGASGATLAEIDEALRLGKGGYDVDDALGELTADLRCRDSYDTESSPEDLGIHIANAVWSAKGHPLAEDYAKLTRDTYAAEAQALDFSGDPEGSAKAINDWSSEATYGKIPEVIRPEQLTGDTLLVLTNAIHFKDGWNVEFDQAKTADADFHLAAGGTKKVPTMRLNEVEFSYAETESYQAIRMPFKDHDTMTFVVPKAVDGLPAVLAALDSVGLDGATWTERRVNLWLPKFKVEVDTGLKPLLKELGIRRAFGDGGAAELADIFADKSLSPTVTDVYQKAYVEVNEKGAEAAAVTVIMAGDSAPDTQEPPPVVDLRVDRPFYFMIEARGAALFTGTVVEP